MVSLLFFILAANNVIKVVRDSLFRSRFPISDLAYVYLLAAVIAGVIISGYTRYTVRMPLYRFILVSNAFIISNVILFWFLIVFFNLSWAIYAFYLGERRVFSSLAGWGVRFILESVRDTLRQALIEYGAVVIEALRESLWDPKISRDIRLSIPRTLSKIESPDAMDALLNGLNQEDGSLRYKIILGLEELSRRFPNLRVDSHVIETSIILEARRYYRRFLIFLCAFWR